MSQDIWVTPHLERIYKFDRDVKNFATGLAIPSVLGAAAWSAYQICQTISTMGALSAAAVGDLGYGACSMMIAALGTTNAAVGAMAAAGTWGIACAGYANYQFVPIALELMKSSYLKVKKFGLGKVYLRELSQLRKPDFVDKILAQSFEICNDSTLRALDLLVIKKLARSEFMPGSDAPER